MIYRLEIWEKCEWVWVRVAPAYDESGKALTALKDAQHKNPWEKYRLVVTVKQREG